MPNAITPKQASFVQEYLIDKNATQAAIRAGYSKKTANEQGARLFANVSVRASIDAALSDIAERTGITAERVLRERARLAFFDVRKLFDKDGFPIPLHQMDEDTAAAIVGVDVMEQFVGDGDEQVLMGFVKKYRFATKDNSLAALEKYLGLNEKAIRCSLPKLSTPEDCARAQSTIIEAVSNGSILPTEADTLSRLVENLRRGFETQEIERRLTALEEHGRAN
jgi:phage terminase small subunit